MKKVAIITGSASGIGLNMAEKFLEQNYNVVFSDINEDALNLAMKNYPQEKILGIKCDVSKESDMQNLIHKAYEKFKRIDVLINNAGLQYVAKIEDFPVDKFKQMIEIMLVGAFCSTKYVLPIMKEQQFGRIINISSINGLIGFAGKAAYNSAKHGLIGLTKVTALECALFNITANAICPGYIDTPLVRGQMQDLANTRGVSVDQVLEEVLYPLIPQKQLIDINDIAALALFLASNEAKHITGQNMIIDAGYTVQ
ncbi:3-hydroxybutyrate dehydrogenase [Campylobacter hepaticus]|uniref:3-hydroxybutyrate dehydrogenase n=1 Tax=Campylobacter hepaticus TaxID=1813019 RepID=A0A6A7JS22_9BACT|nr:3-hydroxybutyrate dehydrogenase [Campylobacter hepaticus]AXP08779.1 3-hydroxybutyrate dehydrogenase [Campylobacter hepaticus]MCZ0772630.1 3-hydroxybutyrate dehydrogenase [Campylobacter hepaticus]MCZ0774098.1 3-hydroxybutyrate dehydrogenase [Campylobacter hepaticus]MCZ0775350.1 3-hydroxybutyrate dehydrogenase [Campylobacter hepaticus]MPV53669.1 3-hydroxybutyrate dehydrogenase [Campylobacter hepaticus]